MIVERASEYGGVAIHGVDRSNWRDPAIAVTSGVTFPPIEHAQWRCAVIAALVSDFFCGVEPIALGGRWILLVYALHTNWTSRAIPYAYGTGGGHFVSLDRHESSDPRRWASDGP